MNDRLRLSNAMMLSLLLHALVLSLAPGAFRSRPHLPSLAVSPLEVDLVTWTRPLPAPAAVPPPASVLLPETQIVNPPDAGTEGVPRSARLLSDRDLTVEREQVRRGDGAKSRVEEVPQTAARTAVSKSRLPAGSRARGAENPAGAGADVLASIPPLGQLLPQPGDVAAGAGAQAAPEQQGEPEGRDFLATGEGSALLLRPGTRDFLPHIREGNITLLNTKAHAFAPFVRRVARRVFEHLAIAFNHAIRTRGIRPGRAAARVEAVMDRAGNFVDARLLERAGTNGLAVDRELLRVARPQTFFDENPPPGAEAEDGNIHFVLFLDLTVYASPTVPAGRGVRGYRGIAGVGLR